MSGFIERLGFWWKCKRKRLPFLKFQSGYGYAIESYNPFKDRATVRVSFRGYVDGYVQWPMGVWQSYLRDYEKSLRGDRDG